LALSIQQDVLFFLNYLYTKLSNLFPLALASEPQRVHDFEFHTGQNFRTQSPEFSAVSPGSGQSFMSHIPWLGDKVAAIENGLYANVQSYAYNTWKSTSDALMEINKDNPAFTREMADAEAAASLGRWVPHVNSENRGISPGSGRAALERTAVSSTSFLTTPALLLKDATSGLAKMATARTINPADAFRTLTGREQLALRQGLRAVTFSAAVVTGSTVAAGLAKGKTPQEIEADIHEALLDPPSI
jgi:hypothetical protein